MEFRGWTSRKVLVAIGALPFAIGLTTLIQMVNNYQDTKTISLVVVIVIFCVGFIMVSLHKSVLIDRKNLVSRWHLFFVLSKEKIIPLSFFSHIEVETATAAQGVGTGQTYNTRYYRIRFVSNSAEFEDYRISDHVLMERRKDIQVCIETAKKLETTTSLPVRYTEQVIEDANEKDESLLSGVT